MESQQTYDITSEIDVYSSVLDEEPSSIATISEMISKIRDGTYLEETNIVRLAVAAAAGMVTEDGKNHIRTAKKARLRAATLSGRVTAGRRKGAPSEGRWKHSGYLQIDIDHPGGPLADVVAKLKADRHIQCVWTSPSGTGVKALAAAPADVAQHAGCFLAAEKHFADIGLTIDTACKDINRLCYLSHDADAWLRDSPAEPFAPAADIPHPKPPPTSGTSQASDSADFLTLVYKVQKLLSYIPRCSKYHPWAEITSAVRNIIDSDVIAEALLQAWDPAEEPDGYLKRFPTRHKEHSWNYLARLAREHGWIAIPEDVMPIPNSGGVTYTKAGECMFAAIGPKLRLFMRGQEIVEVQEDEAGTSSVSAVSPEKFMSRIEDYGRVAKCEIDKETNKTVWRRATLPKGHAEVLMNSEAAKKHLPKISQVVRSPVLCATASGYEVLGRGWHASGGGTFVTGGEMPAVVPLDDAVENIKGLFRDVLFVSDGDRSRALASVVSPALRIGCFLPGVNFPLDLAEGTESQSGKTFRLKLVATIYSEQATAITQPEGGPGSLDEAVGAALKAGKPFILIDNFRGKLRSTILEQAICGTGTVSVRVAYSAACTVNTTPFLWQMSTNGAELNKDMANRAIITRIRKQPDSYEWTKFLEGDLLDHVAANRATFLGSVHAIVRAWVEAGKKRTNESRHDFKPWCQTMDWIVQNLFGAAPLLDGHKEQQQRTCNPNAQWLRDVTIAIVRANGSGATLKAQGIAEICEGGDITLPGTPANNDVAMRLKVGRIMGSLFDTESANSIHVDGYTVTRSEKSEPDHDGNFRKVKYYTFSIDHGQQA